MSFTKQVFWIKKDDEFQRSELKIGPITQLDGGRFKIECSFPGVIPEDMKFKIHSEGLIVFVDMINLIKGWMQIKEKEGFRFYWEHDGKPIDNEPWKVKDLFR